MSRPPDRGRLALPGSLAVALLGAAALLARVTEPPSVMDEFLPLVAAQRILAGEVPYRDFTSLYPPLVPLLDAGLFAAFAPSAIAARVVFVLMVAGGIFALARAAARLSGRVSSGTAVGAMAALTVLPIWGYSLEVAAILVVASLHGVLVADESPTRRRAWLAGAGLLLGLATLARLDLAVAGAPLALLVAGDARPGQRARDLAAFAAGACGPLLVGVGFLGAAGALAAAWQQLVVVPATLYPAGRALPLPAPFAGGLTSWTLWPLFHFYGPALVALLLAATRARARDPRERRLARGVALLVLLLYLPAKVRSDVAHASAARFAAPLALALLARGPWTRGRKAALAAALVLFVPCVARTVTACASAIAAARLAVLADAGPELGIQLTDDSAARAAAIDYLATHGHGERIFVGLPRHDILFGNEVGFYFDARLLPATRHHELTPWLAHARFQEEIVADLERERARFVVLVDALVPDEPNETRHSSGVFTVDRYLAAHYSPVFSDGAYHVLERR